MCCSRASNNIASATITTSDNAYATGPISNQSPCACSTNDKATCGTTGHYICTSCTCPTRHYTNSTRRLRRNGSSPRQPILRQSQAGAHRFRCGSHQRQLHLRQLQELQRLSRILRARDVPSSSCAASGEILTAVMGTITDGEGKYLNDQSCTWILAPEGASNVVLYFSQLSMQKNKDFVYLEACTNATCEVAFPIGTYSHRRPKDPISSNTPAMRVTMSTDGAGRKHGFSATYATSVADCLNGEVVDMNAPSGFILEKNGRYGKNAQCSWHIESRSQLHLQFHEFQTEQCYDHVDVEICSSESGLRQEKWASKVSATASRRKMGSKASGGGFVQSRVAAGCSAVPESPFSGKILPQPVVAQHGAMNVRFSSDGSIQSTGFVAKYSRYGAGASEPTTCASSGAVLTAATGILSDGEGKYSNDQTCVWLLAPDQASNVVLLFEQFQFQKNKDFVKLEACRNTSCIDPVEIGSFTGSRPKNPIESGTPVMRVTMTTDSSKTKKGKPQTKKPKSEDNASTRRHGP
mmetsp:Transcript_31269/g.48990  ORF Transcript_31269/g.48990 Transcript_31269/m.48990 type:complete len:522 (+) Transcript_31269:2628-4193(+)